MIKRLLFFAIFTVSFCYEVYSQQVVLNNTSEINVLYNREVTGAININTLGIGGIFRHNTSINFFKSNFYEIGFSTYRDPKEKWFPALYHGYKKYKFGKLNNVLILRGSLGNSYSITKKPYWGGVEIQLCYSAGISIALAIPIYLYVVAIDSTGGISNKFHEALERYNPDKHSNVNILGQGPFYKGLTELTPHPGLFGKVGFNFEFGEFTESVKSLEIGITFDCMLFGVPIMAYNDPKNMFFSLYMSFHWGKRFNK